MLGFTSKIFIFIIFISLISIPIQSAKVYIDESPEDVEQDVVGSFENLPSPSCCLPRFSLFPLFRCPLWCLFSSNQVPDIGAHANLNERPPINLSSNGYNTLAQDVASAPSVADSNRLHEPPSIANLLESQNEEKNKGFMDFPDCILDEVFQYLSEEVLVFRVVSSRWKSVADIVINRRIFLKLSKLDRNLFRSRFKLQKERNLYFTRIHVILNFDQITNADPDGGNMITGEIIDGIIELLPRSLDQGLKAASAALYLLAAHVFVPRLNLFDVLLGNYMTAQDYLVFHRAWELGLCGIAKSLSLRSLQFAFIVAGPEKGGILTAIRNGHVKCALTLLKSIFQYFLQSNHVANFYLIKAAKESLIDPNAQFFKHVYSEFIDFDYHEVLIEALRRGNIVAFRRLAHLAYENSHGLAHHLMAGDEVELLEELDQMRILLSALGPDSYQGKSALHFAAEHGAFNCLEYIFTQMSSSITAHYMKLQDFQGLVPLHYATHQDNAAMYRYVLDRTPGVRDAFIESMTNPLHTASYHGHASVVNAILDEHRDWANLVDEHGRLPLHLACMMGRVVVVQELLKATSTAVLDQRTNLGQQTVLHMAIGSGISEIVEMIMGTGVFDGLSLNLLNPNTPVLK